MLHFRCRTKQALQDKEEEEETLNPKQALQDKEEEEETLNPKP